MKSFLVLVFVLFITHSHFCQQEPSIRFCDHPEVDAKPTRPLNEYIQNLNENADCIDATARFYVNYLVLEDGTVQTFYLEAVSGDGSCNIPLKKETEQMTWIPAQENGKTCAQKARMPIHICFN